MLTFPVSHWGGSFLPTPMLSGTGGSTGAGAAHITISRAFAVGDLAVVELEDSVGGNSFTSMTDNRGNSYTRIINVTSPASLGVWYSIITTALQVGDTINYTVGNNHTSRVFGVAGPIVASPVDIATGVFSGSGSSISQTVASRSYEPEVIFFWGTQAAGFLTGVTMTGLNYLGTISGSFGIAGALSTRSLASIPFTVSWTQGAGAWSGVFVSFKLAR